jgi:hypothetical protein
VPFAARDGDKTSPNTFSLTWTNYQSCDVMRVRGMLPDIRAEGV